MRENLRLMTAMEMQSLVVIDREWRTSGVVDNYDVRIVSEDLPDNDTDIGIAVGQGRPDADNLIGAGDIVRQLFDLAKHDPGCLVDAALKLPDRYPALLPDRRCRASTA